MNPRVHVVVLMGGMSAEYDISMKSGEQVLQHLDEERYRTTAIEITRSGEWVFPGDEREYLDIGTALARLTTLHVDCVFLALHGPFGEDGRIQGLLDLFGIPYTGSGCAASALAMDKVRSKAIMQHAGILVADEVVFTHHDWRADRDAVVERVSQGVGFPCVIKNPQQGSSLGMAIPQTEEEFRSAVPDVLGFGYTVMAERYIEGLELTCGVLDLDEEQGAYALPVTEIRPVKAKFFDYQAKYTPNATKEITPAEIDDAIRDAVQEISVRAHALMGCRGFSRSDMIVSGDAVYWLEVNTIPGLTETSLLPQGAAAAGMSFTELVGDLVEAALV